MTIPVISRTNVLAAIEHIQREGVPASRQSTRYCLVHDGRRYPPKYVVSLAVKEARGWALDPQEFSGGVETNSLLRRLGFSVITVSGDAVATPQRLVTLPVTKRGLHGDTEVPQTSAVTAHGVPLIGRVVVHGKPGDSVDGEDMLLDVLTNQWPAGLHLKFLITPGGFIDTPFPAKWYGGVGWDSIENDLKVLQVRAEKVLSETITERVLRASEGKIDILTIGIDLSSDGSYEEAELVAVYELASRRVFWTGKSYPTGNQERSLVQVVDLSTHLLEIADERVLVLGCHDLNMFSPRGWANQTRGGVRRQRCEQMRSLARRFAPTLVLQHPHSTDSPNIWRVAWAGLTQQLPSVKAWASGIGYHRWGEKPRAPLDKVLAETRGGIRCKDFIVKHG